MIEFPWSEPPDSGQMTVVAPGIRWIRLPLPFRLDHVNCWLLGNGKDTVLVDTGLGTPVGINLWQETLGENVPGHVLVTHYHPDHMGLAGWFHEQGSQLIGSEIEIAMADEICAFSDAQYGEIYANWYRSNGLPDEAATTVKSLGNVYRKGIYPFPDAATWNLLELIGHGHAPAMLMLYCETLGLLIAADQVLPSITPNVSLMPKGGDADPLASFLKDCQALKSLPANTLVLPSHGLPFRGLHSRLDSLLVHHAKRLDEVAAACQIAKTPYALFDVLFGKKLDAQQMSFALGESLAHLVHLEHKGELERYETNGQTHFLQSGSVS